MNIRKFRCVINPDYISLHSFIESVPYIYGSKGEMIYDKRNKIKAFVVSGKTIIVKRFHKPFFHQRIDYTFTRPSKAQRAYNFALRLKQMGIDTPDAIAYIEEYRYGLFYTGFFFSANNGNPDLRILRKDLGNESLINDFASFIVQMHKKGFMHGDLNLSNILYCLDTNTGHYHFSVIDTNRSVFICNPTMQQCLNNLKRISHDRNIIKCIVGKYADIQGWDKDTCIRYVLKKIQKFEQRKAFLRKLKHILFRH